MSSSFSFLWDDGELNWMPDEPYVWGTPGPVHDMVLELLDGAVINVTPTGPVAVATRADRFGVMWAFLEADSRLRLHGMLFGSPLRHADPGVIY